MRFLFGSRPFRGHLYPMVPLARELVRRGHRVVVGSAAIMEHDVRSAGLEFRVAGSHPLDPQPGRAGGPSGGGQFSSYALAQKIDDLLSIENIDVVVREPTDFAAATVADVMRVPHATIGFSYYLSADSWRVILGRQLDAVRTRFGLLPDPDLTFLTNNLYLDTTPSWFYPAPIPISKYARIEGKTYEGQTDEAMRYPNVPYAYVTLGTVYNQDPNFFRVAIEAAANCGLGVVVSTGSTELAEALSALNSEDRVITAYVPQSQVLCGASLVICHGGFSTTIGAIRAGLPLVLVPYGSDQIPNAERCKTLGLGLVLKPSDWAVDTAERAIMDSLADSGRAQKARRIAEDDQELPTVEDAATLLENLHVPHVRETPAQWLSEISKRNRDVHYSRTNRAGWQALSRAGCESSIPLGRLSANEAKLRLDPDAWFPWERIRSVLCLASGGGQQAPLFAGLGCKVLVCDLSGEQLRRDREVAAVQGLAIETLEADMCDLSALGDRKFDLIYQPVSTCYVPDVRRVYAEVYAHLRPGGWYCATHLSPLQLQLDDQRPWDGAAYRVIHRQNEKVGLPWTTTLGDETVVIKHYVHGFGDLVGGLCDAGFTVERFVESTDADPEGQPGETRHAAAYFPTFLRLFARKTGNHQTFDEPVLGPLGAT